MENAQYHAHPPTLLYHLVLQRCSVSRNKKVKKKTPPDSTKQGPVKKKKMHPREEEEEEEEGYKAILKYSM
jgi:hypothetical protein